MAGDARHNSALTIPRITTLNGDGDQFRFHYTDGKVNFVWEGNSIGEVTLNASGVATLTKSNLNAGSYPLTAVYSGDANNAGSTSAILNQVVTETTSAAHFIAEPVKPRSSGDVRGQDRVTDRASDLHGGDHGARNSATRRREGEVHNVHAGGRPQSKQLITETPTSPRVRRR
jgi:hypothetical protein